MKVGEGLTVDSWDLPKKPLLAHRQIYPNKLFKNIISKMFYNLKKNYHSLFIPLSNILLYFQIISVIHLKLIKYVCRSLNHQLSFKYDDVRREFNFFICKKDIQVII